MADKYGRFPLSWQLPSYLYSFTPKHWVSGMNANQQYYTRYQRHCTLFLQTIVRDNSTAVQTTDTLLVGQGLWLQHVLTDCSLINIKQIVYGLPKVLTQPNFTDVFEAKPY